MTLLDGFKGSAAVSGAIWCGDAQPRGSGVSQRRRLQRTSAPSLAFGWVLKAADMKSVRPGSAQCGFAQPILNLSGQRSYTDERLRTGDIPVGATSRSGGVRMGDRNLGNPCAEKVLQDCPRQTKGAAPLTKALSAFRRIGGAVSQGMLTITGSNVRLGTEMPVALSSFSL